MCAVAAAVTNARAQKRASARVATFQHGRQRVVGAGRGRRAAAARAPQPEARRQLVRRVASLVEQRREPTMVVACSRPARQSPRREEPVWPFMALQKLLQLQAEIDRIGRLVERDRERVALLLKREPDVVPLRLAHELVVHAERLGHLLRAARHEIRESLDICHDDRRNPIQRRALQALVDGEPLLVQALPNQQVPKGSTNNDECQNNDDRKDPKVVVQPAIWRTSCYACEVPETTRRQIH
mmetsp:Transcript_15715/g.46390  ORF Transcript_15715/g.46390 Transcript_15715/m.46390 type:complete len:241 (+) Transcript_15715:1103-1825(+)